MLSHLLTLSILLQLLICTTTAQDCQYVGWTYTNTPCPKGKNEVYRDMGQGPTYLRMCCTPGSEGEKNQKRSAPNCRATKCLSSSGGDMCSTLDERYMNNQKLVYEEVMRDTCTRGRSPGVVALCCRVNSTEGVLVTALGAEHNEFPHQVKVKPVDCGGTIYNKRFVITAAHCVVDNDGNVQNATKFKAVVGTNIGDMDLNSKEYAYQVKKIIVHEEYSRLASNPNNELGQIGSRIYNDMALLELEDEFIFSDKIKPLEIASEGFDPFAHADNAVIVGWGTTENLALAIHLQKANFILRKDKRCFGGGGKWPQYSNYRGQLLCVGGIMDNQFSWTAGGGDSGGPAICRKADGNPVLCGVTSFGGDDEACAINSNSASCPPSVYAEVSHFKPWIEANTEGGQDEQDLYRPYLYGKDVSKAEYQHQVHITSATGKACGGTLVAPDIVVTAAQCIMTPGTGKSHPDLKVTVGQNDLKADPGKQFRVKDARVLFGFEKINTLFENVNKEDRMLVNDGYYKNDLAVVKLDKKVSRPKKFPKLPAHREPYYEGVELSFPRNTTRSGKLRSREYEMLDELECQRRMDRIGGKKQIDLKVDRNLLCGVEKYSGGSTCDRELGGGLICKGTDGEDVLCGVQTFRLCMLSIPNGFVNMGLFRNWVDTAMKQLK